MIKKESKIKRDNENKIICEKHKLFVNTIWIEKNCDNILNCMDCVILDNHLHLKNINISNLLNYKIDNYMFNEKFYNLDKIIYLIKNKIDIFRKSLINNINLFEQKMIKKIKNESKEVIIIEKKKNFKKVEKFF